MLSSQGINAAFPLKEQFLLVCLHLCVSLNSSQLNTIYFHKYCFWGKRVFVLWEQSFVSPDLPKPKPFWRAWRGLSPWRTIISGCMVRPDNFKGSVWLVIDNSCPKSQSCHSSHSTTDTALSLNGYCHWRWVALSRCACVCDSGLGKKLNSSLHHTPPGCSTS